MFQSFGSTPSPQTPGYPGPYTPGTPGTPSGNIYGSPMAQTPSPVVGNPLTPGSGLGPLSPMTPGATFDDCKFKFDYFRSCFCNSVTTAPRG